MPTQTYVTAQLAKITLEGTYGDISRERVRGFIGGIGGLGDQLFSPADITSPEGTTDGWYTSRETSYDAQNPSDLTTYSVTDASITIPNTVVSANLLDSETVTTQLNTFLSNISDNTVEPFVSDMTWDTGN